ncbi:LysR family transcriptional regulator [Mesorhizobium sp. B2-5-13]|nr:LysR family transcriptional regulator [Mesorhizobium sp. B2-5-13]TPK45853.1 LysR family transcriptional regulator [Mesorhizobium sp. B2-5-5]
MYDHLFDLRLFRYALAAAEHGSFRKAASALGTQQSSVSKGVGSLEHRLGIPLFNRDHTGVRTTPAGERFLQEAALGFDHFRRAVHDIDATQRGDGRRLVVAFSAPFLLFGDVLRRFRHDHEGLSFQMIEATCEASVMLVQQRKADLAFVTETTNDPALQALRLSNEQMTAVLAGPRRFHGGVERKQVRLEGNVVNHADNVRNLARRSRNFLHSLGRLTHHHTTTLGRFAHQNRLAIGLVGPRGVFQNSVRELADRRRCLLDRRRLSCSPLGQIVRPREKFSRRGLERT